jgi:hypothetical protein
MWPQLTQVSGNTATVNQILFLSKIPKPPCCSVFTMERCVLCEHGDTEVDAVTAFVITLNRAINHVCVMMTAGQPRRVASGFTKIL